MKTSGEAGELTDLCQQVRSGQSRKDPEGRQWVIYTHSRRREIETGMQR
jgi:hypothetical protein